MDGNKGHQMEIEATGCFRIFTDDDDDKTCADILDIPVL